MRKYIPVYSPDFAQDERSALTLTACTSDIFTAFHRATQFEREFARRLNMRHATFTNSGSSAVLVAVSAMKWKRGDKIITPAVTFGTTISPLIMYGMVPVLIDVIPGTYNVDPEKVQDALCMYPDIKGAVIPHTLGNPVDPGIWGWFDRSVEDSCDALGSMVGGRNCGSFGTVSSFSFFPAHHITTIEGGMVLTSNSDVARDVFRFANWGRDCWCRAGEDSVCNRRFDITLGGIDYDHKYEFRYPGFNVRGDELRASVGLVQMKKLDKYEATRRRNFKTLNDALSPLEDLIVLPKSIPGSDPCWFAYPITLRNGNRKCVTGELEAKGIATRLIFAGNITKHGIMDGVEYISPHGLENSDDVMRNSFTVGCGHTVTEEEIKHIADTVTEVITK